MLDRRRIKNLALGAVLLAVAFAFVRFFLSQLSQSGQPGRLGTGQTSELAAVAAAPPRGFEIVELGAMAPARAASELASLLAAGSGRIGIRFDTPRAKLYWLADPAGDTLEERSAGAAGTRLATLWTGQLRRRLDWAATHDGDLSPPGLAPPERKNLYH